MPKIYAFSREEFNRLATLWSKRLGVADDVLMASDRTVITWRRFKLIWLY